MATKGVACDVCAKKSARWYCSADAAYLCDLCDAQVHTANSLARRHERLRVTPTGGKVSSKKRLSPQVLPARKRTRSSRPHPHRPQCTAHDQGMHVQMEEINLEDFLVDHPQEVPSLLTDSSSQEYSSHSMSYSSHSSLQSPDCNSPASFRSSDDESSFAAYFKGKAALTEAVIEFEAVVPTGIDIICCDADGNISMADDDACFLPGDIPGLDAFDDCSLSFDLAHTVPTETSGIDHSAKQAQQWSPEIMKSERPMLRLNYEEIIAVWSDRGEPWVNPECNKPTILAPSKLVMPVLVC